MLSKVQKVEILKGLPILAGMVVVVLVAKGVFPQWNTTLLPNEVFASNLFAGILVFFGFFYSGND